MYSWKYYFREGKEVVFYNFSEILHSQVKKNEWSNFRYSKKR